jgi:exosortase N
MIRISKPTLVKMVMVAFISKIINERPVYTVGIFIAVNALMAWVFLSNYFIWDINVFTALVLSPYCIISDARRKGGIRYLLFSLLFVMLTWFTGVLTFYFLAIGLAILFVIESMAGQLNYIPLFLLGLVSPTFKYVNNLFGFPVRLKLSELAGKTLHCMGYKTEVSGNVIAMNGSEFSVDPACVGLKMMAVSILAGLLFMAYFQRKTGKKINFTLSLLFLLTIVGLNILGNFLRILLLVLFKLVPEDPMHDTVGMICLVLYVVLPSYFILKWVFYGIKTRITSGTCKSVTFRTILVFNAVLMVVMIITGFTRIKMQKKEMLQIPEYHLPGYIKTIVSNDIIKLEKPGCLIYIKPLDRFYGAEHNPMICWVGSGYEFCKINKQVMDGKEVFTGTLKKGSDVIYAAWWFDNGSYQTVDQFDWRRRALCGERFCLVNVNSTSINRLSEEIKMFLKNNEYATKAEN